MSVTEAAHGIYQVVNENMISATRVHVAERGADPRQLKLIAFGGAGPVHAHQIARALKMKGYICPASAGVTSALGFLTAPAAFEFARTHIAQLTQDNLAELDAIYAELEAEGRMRLAEAGVPAADMTFQRKADLRHVGQGHEIAVPLPYREMASVSLADDLQPLFYAHYDQIYGYAHRHLGARNYDLPADCQRPAARHRPAGSADRHRRGDRRRQEPPPRLLRRTGRLRRYAHLRPLCVDRRHAVRRAGHRGRAGLHRRHRPPRHGHGGRLRQPDRDVGGRTVNNVSQTGANDAGASRYRFGFDIGGTFTDFVLIDNETGEIHSYKALTTPHQPAQAVIEGWHTLLAATGAPAARSTRPFMAPPSSPMP